MISIGKRILAVIVFAGLFSIVTTFDTAMASGQSPSAAPQAAGNGAAETTADSQKVIAGEIEARRLVFLMDTDKNGKVSRAEFMAFMAAEFDRMDTNKDGELDVRELAKSQLMVVRHGGGHR
jgi:EF hand